MNCKINQFPACVNDTSIPCMSPEDNELQMSKSIDGCLKYFFWEIIICQEIIWEFLSLYAPWSRMNTWIYWGMMFIIFKKPLCKLFNLSFNSGIFNDEWKKQMYMCMSCTFCIIKNNTGLLNNYPPPQILDNVMERCTMYMYIFKHSQLSSWQ